MDAKQPFIDCHHHIWAPRGDSHPWLMPDANTPFRYGDPTPIKGDYLPDDYDRDATGFDVVGHVTMEAEWNDRDPVAETRWTVDEVADRPDYLAHVARVILHADDAEAVMASHAEHDLVRGVRHKPLTAASPGVDISGASGSLTDPDWQRGFRHLSTYGLHYELQAPWWHAEDLLRLCDQCPDTPIVLNHMFMPGTRDPQALAGWRDAITKAATNPAITIKVSGMGLAGRPWRRDDHTSLIDHVVDTFGPSRCMVASNFPVDGLCGSYSDIIGGYLKATEDLSVTDRNALFHDTAVRVYRLDLNPLRDGA